MLIGRIHFALLNNTLIAFFVICSPTESLPTKKLKNSVLCVVSNKNKQTKITSTQ